MTEGLENTKKFPRRGGKMYYSHGYVWLFTVCAFLYESLLQGSPNIHFQQSSVSLEVGEKAACRWPGVGVEDGGHKELTAVPFLRAVERVRQKSAWRGTACTERSACVDMTDKTIWTECKLCKYVLKKLLAMAACFTASNGHSFFPPKILFGFVLDRLE